MGRHLPRRLAEVGARDVFTVPGDFNLTLLDELEAEPGVRLVGCCNELNAAYAADGYSRARGGGVSACAVTSPSAGSAPSTPSPARSARTCPWCASSGAPTATTTEAIASCITPSGCPISRRSSGASRVLLAISGAVKNYSKNRMLGRRQVSDGKACNSQGICYVPLYDTRY